MQDKDKGRYLDAVMTPLIALICLLVVVAIAVLPNL